MLSDANLINQRAVPDLDMAGNPLTNMAQAFFIAQNRWVGYRIAPGSNPEIYISNNNRKLEKACQCPSRSKRYIFNLYGKLRLCHICSLQGGPVHAAGGEIVGLMKIAGLGYQEF